MRSKIFVLGVTGDIGAGKSTAASILVSMGARCFDADSFVRELWTRSELLDAVRERWGDGVLDDSGRSIPSEISNRFFEDEVEYRWLCSLVHPMVRREIERALTSERGWVVVEIPLLFESAVPHWCDMTLYVAASQEVRIERNRGRFSQEELERRERFLLPSEEKRSLADLVLWNDGTPNDLRRLLEPHGLQMARMGSVCAVTVQCSFRNEACRLISSLLRDRLAYQARLIRVETAYTGYDQFLTENWEVRLYTLIHLVRDIHGVAAKELRRLPTPMVVADVLRADRPFMRAVGEACR